jgi:hypothetical protein
VRPPASSSPSVEPTHSKSLLPAGFQRH